MPTRIKQLATSLEAIIDQYYGPRGKVVTDDQLAYELSGEPEPGNTDEYVQIDLRIVSTEDHIQTAALKKTPVDRAPLMNYLAYWANQLDKLHENPKPLQNDVIIRLKQEVVQFLYNLQSLLRTHNTDQIRVTYEGNDVMLYGCYNCKSGAIIQDVLFSRIKQSGKQIEEYITELFNAHQNPLLVQENEHLSHELLLRDVSELELKSELAAMREHVENGNQRLAEMRVQIEDEKQRFANIERNFAASNQELIQDNACLNLELSRIKCNETLVSELRDEMDTILHGDVAIKLKLRELQSELKDTETQLQDSEKTIYYLQEQLTEMSRKSRHRSAHVNQSIFKVIEDRIGDLVDYLNVPCFSEADFGRGISNAPTESENQDELYSVNATDFNPHLL